MTDKLSGYSTTPASNNAASPDGWPEGMTAGSVNNSDREFAARVREFYEDSPWIDYGHTIVSSTGSTIKLSTDVTAIYTAGRAIRINQDASMDGWVTASAYSAPDTSITVTGFTIAAPTQVEVGAIKDHAPLPNNLSITVASLAVTGTLNVTGTLTAGVLVTTINTESITTGTMTASEYYNSNGDPFTRVPNMDVKTSGTAATWTWPTGVTCVRITLIGAGGTGQDSSNQSTAGTSSTIVYNSITVTAGGGGGGGGAAGVASNGTLNFNGKIATTSSGADSHVSFGPAWGVAGLGYGTGGGAIDNTRLGGSSGAMAVYRVEKVSGLNTITYTVGSATDDPIGGGDAPNGAPGLIIFEY